MAGISLTLGNPGTLDTSFGGDGKVTTSVGAGNAGGIGVLVQPDGKIVVGGSSYGGTLSDHVLLRYQANGNLDDGFAVGGKVTMGFGAGDDSLFGLALAPNGAIIASGTTWSGESYATDGAAALIRYTAAGQPDSSFGTAGKVITHIGTGDDALTFGSALQPDGKIVVAGIKGNSDTDSDFAVLRYLSTGVLDATFSGDGKATTSFGSGEDAALGLALQPDGKIILAGGAEGIDGGIDIALARYTTDGVLDSSFGSGGKVVTDLGTGDGLAVRVLVQPDGKIVVCGAAEITEGDSDIVLVRYLQNGALDSSFGDGGKVVTKLTTGSDIAFGAVIQVDGGIVVAATSDSVSDGDFVLIGYRANGSLDTRLGGDGIVSIDFGGDDQAAGIALQADGRLVLTGAAGTVTNDDVGVARVFGTTNTVKGTAGIDTLTGASGLDTIKGLGGADVIKGSGGDDALYGGAGNDKLTGGTGADRFVFDTALASNKDSVLDFKVGEHDRIVLDNDIFTKLGAPKTLAVDNFASGSAHDANDYIIYKQATGALYYDADGNGTGSSPVQFATMVAATHPTLHNTDFLIVN